MYISFFPLKSKSSAAVATALQSYISFQGVPKIIYSDNDPSFKNEVEELLTSFNIQHATAYPYTQIENAVESQVRKFKNAGSKCNILLQASVKCAGEFAAPVGNANHS